MTTSTTITAVTAAATITITAVMAGATMTDRARGLAVVTAAGALFCLALIFLALQIRAGRDPAIGADAQEPRQVIVRRVIVRRIVEVDDPAAPARATTTRPAPAPGAPAPAAPAPVTSRGS
jgi:hypothetical protein